MCVRVSVRFFFSTTWGVKQEISENCHSEMSSFPAAMSGIASAVAAILISAIERAEFHPPKCTDFISTDSHDGHELSADSMLVLICLMIKLRCVCCTGFELSSNALTLLPMEAGLPKAHHLTTRCFPRQRGEALGCYTHTQMVLLGCYTQMLILNCKLDPFIRTVQRVP